MSIATRLGMRCGTSVDGSGRASKVKKNGKSKDQLMTELRSAYERGASIRSLVATTGHSYGSIHSMLRESGTPMRSRGGPNHRGRRAS
ncbi:hypothetical protein Mvan_2743 [Mycolicibacterium vanbaalenii PYR-1]|uniref:Helix-turn-helix domain-containing protein n=1 Tax=Mycolicibacterium vanbaalenii (strain DSM 7251 / JCM 13017 / BCRC 16820 / KCTC 9966 / NRRL B-24157 / PYR-1) TaxID=350058 RepID=A1T8Q0_MYCVP|nr:hypothetical protein Mvan_2743 [Mycolicibacterium vanbaalenii PYR-1]